MESPQESQQFSEIETRHSYFWATFFLILFVYSLWMVTFWPGTLGEDSLAVALEIETNGVFQSGKPVFWYYFVKLFYTGLGKFEYPIIVQFLISALIFSRILAWCRSQEFRKTYCILLFFLCIAPHSILMIGSLYADGVYAAATTALVFELWLVSKRKAINFTSTFIIFTTLPFATFARPNGIIMLAAMIGTAFFLKKSDKKKIYFIGLFWICLIIFAGNLHKTNKHDTLYPLALFETVNFLQPRPMNLWRSEPRISEKTLQILEKYQPIEKIIKSYDKDYWDTLVYLPGGPQLNQLTKSDKKEIVKQFFSHNLWENLPSFVSSRVNVFLTSALAQGATWSPDYAESVISKTKSTSEYRKFQLLNFEKFFKKIHDFSYTYRIILWTSLYGVIILLFSIFTGLRKHDKSILLVTTPLLLQLVGIFLLSIAGEYRYLFQFFLLPIALLPILLFSKNHTALPLKQ